MRIIAGEHRGRRLATPAGLATRPMLERVREAVFSTLRDWIDEARVLDLFAGSGSLGLEALSRGARSCIFVERHRPTAELLRENVRSLGLEERARVVVGDALSSASFGESAEFDLVFLDPPYAMWDEARDRGRVLAALAQLVAKHLEHRGRLLLHVPRDALKREELPRDLDASVRRYGTNDLWYVGASRAAAERAS